MTCQGTGKHYDTASPDFFPEHEIIWDRSNRIKASFTSSFSFTGGMLLTYGCWALTHSNLQILAKMSASWDCVWYACASLVGPRRHSINAIVGANEWMKEFLIMSYKFLHQQNNPIGKQQCTWNSCLWRVLFSTPSQFFFFCHLCSTGSFLIFLNQGVKSTEAFSRTWKTSVVLRKFPLYVACVW